MFRVQIASFRSGMPNEEANVNTNNVGQARAHIVMEPFIPKSGKWKVYLARLEQQFFAQHVVDVVLKKAHLLSVIGAEVCELVWDLFEPVDPSSDDVTYKDICDKLTAQFVPVQVEIAQRYHFYQRKQKKGESVTDYLAALRHMATGCSFGTFLPSALRDVFVFGLCDVSVQKKLLTMEKLTLEEAFKEAQSNEAVEQQSKAMQEPKTANEELVYLMKNRCGRCGGPHLADSCRFRFLNCNACGKRGHKAAVCRSGGQKRQHQHRHQNSANTSEQPSKIKNDNRRGVNYVEDEEVGSDVELYRLEEVNHMNNKEADPPIYATIKINGHVRQMEIDTGAGSTILSERTWKQIGRPVLRPSWIRLKTYTGHTVTVKGEFEARVEIDGASHKLPVLVAEGNGPDLIGRRWLRRVKLNWNKIFKLTITDLSQKLAPFEEVFRKELGTIRVPQVKLHLRPGAVPKFHRPRPIPYALREEVKAELQRLEDAGIVERVEHSDWAAPIVVVKKANGSLRICGDYKVSINEALIVDQYPLPLPEDLFATLEGGALFTKLDLSQAYLQLELDVDSRDLVTINTPFGLFRYTRMPFGVSSAPSKFQKVMDDLFRDLPWVKVFLDDILIAGRSPEEHWNRVTEVLRRLKSAGIRLQREKCHFAVKELPYLGYIVSHEGLKTSPSKIKAIREAPRPTNVTSLRTFLGLVQYYAKFIPKMSDLTAPLNKLLRKNKTWEWTPDQERAWKSLKDALSSTEVLCPYQPELPLRLACDASPFGVAAVLSHVMPDGSERPIAYASKTLSAAERNYSQLDKEALAIIFGVRRFHSYIYGRTFTLITDHKPLLGLLGPKCGIPPLAAARMQRWALILAAYRYQLEFRRTEDHANVDAFSRFPLPSQNDSSAGMPPESLFHVEFFEASITVEDVRRETRLDPILSTVYGRLKDGWKPEDSASELMTFYRKRTELALCEGLILWGRRVVIPTRLRQKVLKLLHEEHQGIVRMKNLARSYVWWPNIDQHLVDLATECPECLNCRKMPGKVKDARWPTPTEPWERVHLDFAGPVASKYLLVLVDASTKWPEIFVMNSMTSSATITALRATFARFGNPVELVTDNGPQFAAAEFEDYMKENGIVHRMGAPYHPETNGLAERMVQTVKSALKKMEKQPGDLLEKVQRFLYSYRNTAHAATGTSPAKLLLGRELRTRLDLLRPQNRQTEVIPANFEVGQTVLARDYRPGQEKWQNGVVERRIGAYLYLIRAGKLVLKRHVDQLLPRTGESKVVPEEVTTAEKTNHKSTEAVAEDRPAKMVSISLPRPFPESNAAIDPPRTIQIEAHRMEPAPNATATATQPVQPYLETSLRRSERLKKIPTRFVPNQS